MSTKLTIVFCSLRYFSLFSNFQATCIPSHSEVILQKLAAFSTIKGRQRQQREVEETKIRGSQLRKSQWACRLLGLETCGDNITYNMGNLGVYIWQAEWLSAMKITTRRHSIWQAHGERGVFHTRVKTHTHLLPCSCGKTDWLSPGLSETVSKQDWTESKQSAVSTPRLFP